MEAQDKINAGTMKELGYYAKGQFGIYERAATQSDLNVLFTESHEPVFLEDVILINGHEKEGLYKVTSAIDFSRVICMSVNSESVLFDFHRVNLNCKLVLRAPVKVLPWYNFCELFIARNKKTKQVFYFPKTALAKIVLTEEYEHALCQDWNGHLVYPSDTFRLEDGCHSVIGYLREKENDIKTEHGWYSANAEQCHGRCRLGIIRREND